MIEQILERFEMLAPETEVYRWNSYVVYASISGKRDSLWLSYYKRGTVRLEYLDNCGETEAELILSPERTLAELTGLHEIAGLLIYVAQRIVPDLDDRFYLDYDVIRAKQSETYQALVAGKKDVLSVIHQFEQANYNF
jgi:hypothetical protein